jgi:hypothetical protein
MTLVHLPSTQQAVAHRHGGGGWGVAIVVHGVWCCRLALPVLEFGIVIV